ncbi:MAG: CHAT domain-containing tetratricopeptide repeat protein [Saprospiraceae bacterium]
MKGFLISLLALVVTFGHAQVIMDTTAAVEIDTAKVSMEVDSLIQLNAVLTDQGDFKSAIEVIKKAKELAISSLGKTHYSVAKSIFGLGRTFIISNNYGEARKCFLEVLPMLENTIGNKNRQYAQTLHNIGMSYHGLGQFREAEIFYSKSKALRKEVLEEGDNDYTLSLDNLAKIYLELSEFVKAEEHLQEALSIREKFSGITHADYLENLRLLGILYSQTAQYDKALKFIKKAKEIYENKNEVNSQGYALLLMSLGTVYFSTSAFVEAEQSYLKSNEILDSLFGINNISYAQSVANLAMVNQALGRIEEAETYYLKAEQIFKYVLGVEHPFLANVYQGIGEFYRLTEQYHKALNVQDKALNIVENSLGRNHHLFGSILENKALVHFKLGEVDTADSLLQSGKKIKESQLGILHANVATSWNNLGYFYYLNKMFSKAEEHLLEAKKLRKEILGVNNLEYFTTLGNLLLLYLDIERFDSIPALAVDLTNISIQQFVNSTFFLTEQELRLFASKFFRVHETLLSSNILFPNRVLSNSSFDLSLLNKGFLLNARYRINKICGADSVCQSKLDDLRNLQAYLSKLYVKPISERANIGEWENRANQLEKDLIQSVSDYGETFDQIKWNDVRSNLNQQETAIEFVHFRFNNPEPTDSIFYAALVLRPGDEAPKFIPLFEEKEIASLLQKANGKRQRYIDDFYFYEEGLPGAQLYQLIWKPLEPYLKDIKTIYYSPSGLLHRINLAAIPLNGQETLGDRYQLSLLGSTRQLVIKDTNQRVDQQAVVIGGVRYQTDTTKMAISNKSGSTAALSLPDILQFQADTTISDTRGDATGYLPYSTQEAVAITTSLETAGYQVQLDTGYTATEEAFRQMGGGKTLSPRILHIATHGYFYPDPQEKNAQTDPLPDESPAFQNSTHPMIRAGLLLAGSEQAYTTGKGPQDREDGVLTAYEISQLDLSNTELVVLSACETGLGDIEGNEGVYGLQRAFKIAGAKYLIMSLWKVNDKATLEFMSSFYEQWLNKKRSIPEAFRKTQTFMKQQYPDSPYLWAGFVLVE